MSEHNFEILRVPNFRKYYATNVYVYSTDVDFRVELLNEKLPAVEGEEEAEEFVSDALLVLTPEAAKKLRDKLDEHIRSFEKKKSKIKISPSRKLP